MPVSIPMPVIVWEGKSLSSPQNVCFFLCFAMSRAIPEQALKILRVKEQRFPKLEETILFASVDRCNGCRGKEHRFSRREGWDPNQGVEVALEAGIASE